MTCVEAHARNGHFTQILSLMLGSWVEDAFGATTPSNITLTPIMALLGALNFLSIIYASIMVAYNGTYLTANAAATGHVFGKISWFLPFRIATCLALLSPAYIGVHSFVSTAQVTGAKVITLGSANADLLFRLGITKYVEYANSAQNGSIIKSTYSSGEKVSQMLLCAISMADSSESDQPKYTLKYSGTSREYDSLSALTSSDILNVYNSQSTSYNSYLPNSYALQPSSYLDEGNEINAKILFSGGDCGSVQFDIPQKPSSSSEAKDKISYYVSVMSVSVIIENLKQTETAMNEFFQVIKDSDKSKLITAMNSGEKNISSEDRKYLLQESKFGTIAQRLYFAGQNTGYCFSIIVNNVMMGNFNSWSTSQARCADSFDTNIDLTSNPTVDELTDGGWIFSGKAFNRLNGLMLIANHETNFNQNYLGEFNIPARYKFCDAGFFSSLISVLSPTDSRDYPELKDEIKDANRCVNYWSVRQGPKSLWQEMRNLVAQGDIESSNLGTKANNYWSDAAGAFNWASALKMTSNKSDALGNTAINENMAISFASSILASVINLGSNSSNLSAAMDTGDYSSDLESTLFTTSVNGNGMATLTAIGEGLKYVFYGILSLHSLISVSSDVMIHKAGFLAAIVGGPILKFLSSILLPLIMSSLAGAFILGNVLPALPIVIMLFIVISFFVICLEAIAGIALGVGLLASASGEGLLAVHGLRMISLYSAILLRPTLHIIGLFAGFMLINFSIPLLNNYWWDGLSGLGITMGLFNLVMLTAGYPIVAFCICAYCLQGPNLFANNLMRWISTDAIGAFGDTSQYIDKTKAAMQGMNSAFNSMLSGQSSPNKPSGNNSASGSTNTPPNQSPNKDKTKAPPTTSE